MRKTFLFASLILLASACVAKIDGDNSPSPLPGSKCGAAYRLVPKRNLSSPFGTSTGIACDGGSLWIVAGGHNAPTHTLARFNPLTFTTERSFTFDNLIE